VIEVDGKKVSHVKSNDTSNQVHRVPIHVGQRFSVIAHKTSEAEAKNTKNFWLRLQANPNCIRYNTPCNEKKQLVETIRSIVSYDSKFSVPQTSPWTDDLGGCVDLNLTLLSPFSSKQNLGLKKKPDKQFNLKLTMFTDIIKEITVGEVFAGTAVNSFVYAYQALPDSNNTLKEVYDLREKAKNVNSWTQSQNVLILDGKDDTIEVVLANADDVAHPLHLTSGFKIERAKCTSADMQEFFDVREFCKKIFMHIKKQQNIYFHIVKHGHFFEVMQITEIGKGGPTIYETPISRDTVTVPPKGTATIRFKVDNPGVWAFHCHIEWHVEVGMMAQFVELPGEILALKKQEGWDKLCENQTPTTH
ncbi:7393_t:CDS:2, partial [Gigaspora rosea]